MSKFTIDELKDQLNSLDLEERINLITQDVKQKTDVFSKISSYNLLDMLGYDSSSPYGDCGFEDVFYKTPFSEIDEPEYLIDKLENHVDSSRYAIISSEDFNCELLTSDEKALIEKINLDEKVKEHGEGDYTRLCFWSVESNKGENLRFEGVVGCGGSCFDLKGPYEERDGKFTDLDSDDIGTEGF